MNLAETALEVSRKRNAIKLEVALRPLKQMDKFRQWVLSLNDDCDSLMVFIRHIQEFPDTKPPSVAIGILKQMFIRYLCKDVYLPSKYDEDVSSMSDDQVNRFFYDLVAEFSAVGLSFEIVTKSQHSKAYIRIVDHEH